MANDLYKRVLFNDGEGLAHTDLNNVGGYINARLFDQVIRARNGNARHTVYPFLRGFPSSAPFLYSLHGGTAYIVPGAGARQTTVRGGTIFQQVGSPTGDESSFIPYTMIDAEFTLTHDVGDANPRVDVIQVKLEYVDANSESRDFEDATTEVVTSQVMNKKRRVQATFSIKKGTAAASPAVPTLDAGYAALAIVNVPALHNAVFVAQTHYSPVVNPIGVKHIRVRANAFDIDSGDTAGTNVIPNEALAGGYSTALDIATGQSNQNFFVCPGLLSHQRLLGIALHGRIEFSGALAIEVKSGDGWGSEGSTVLADLGPLITSSSTLRTVYLSAADIETRVATALGNAKNAEGLGRGVWGNGTFHGPAQGDVGNFYDDRTVYLKFNVNTTGTNWLLTAVDFIYADGL